MPSDSANPSAVLLVAAGAAGKEVLRATATVLDQFGVPHHAMEAGATVDDALTQSSPAWLAVVAASPDHELPARWARLTKAPTLRVPVAGQGRHGLELLRDGSGGLPSGDADAPFATMAIGEAGAKNAALFVVAMLAVSDEALREQWLAFRARQTASVLAGPTPSLDE